MAVAPPRTKCRGCIHGDGGGCRHRGAGCPRVMRKVQEALWVPSEVLCVERGEGLQPSPGRSWGTGRRSIPPATAQPRLAKPAEGLGGIRPAPFVCTLPPETQIQTLFSPSPLGHIQPGTSSLSCVHAASLLLPLGSLVPGKKPGAARLRRMLKSPEMGLQEQPQSSSCALEMFQLVQPQPHKALEMPPPRSQGGICKLPRWKKSPVRRHKQALQRDAQKAHGKPEQLNPIPPWGPILISNCSASAWMQNV